MPEATAPFFYQLTRTSSEGIESPMAKPLALITSEERARRQRNADGARASVGLEGFKPSAATEERCRRYINGEITLEELVDVRRAEGDATQSR